MAYIILLGIIKLQDFSKLVVKFVGRGLNIYEKERLIALSSVTSIEKLNSQLNLFQEYIVSKYIFIKNLKYIKFICNKFLFLFGFIDKNILSISIFMIFLGIYNFLYWETSGFTKIERSALARISDVISISPLVISGLIFMGVIKLQKIQNSTKNTILTDGYSKERFLVFFNRRIDLKYLQIILLILITFFHFYYNNRDCFSLEEAVYNHYFSYILSIVLIVIGYFLYSSNDKVFGSVTLALGVIYITYRHLIFTEHECFFASSFEKSNAHIIYILLSRDTDFLDFSEYFWIIILTSIIPQFQFLRIKSLRFGEVRGDLRHLLTHKFKLRL